jgi:hypothetical protein
MKEKKTIKNLSKVSLVNHQPQRHQKYFGDIGFSSKSWKCHQKFSSSLSFRAGRQNVKRLSK